MRLLFNQVAPTWDAIRADGTYLARFEQALDRLAALHPNAGSPATVLDVACGTGLATELLADRFPGARIAGQDIASAMVERARERLPRSEFVTGSSAQLPFDDGEFDLVTSVDGVWEAAELARVTAPGGCILLIFTFGGACPVARDLAPVAVELEGLGMACDLELGESWTLVARQLD